MTDRDPSENEFFGICSVSGKTTLQLKDFTQIQFSDNYCTSLKKIGDSILFIQSRGNLSHHNADHFYSKLDAFCKAAKIEPPYVQIRDFTYLEGRTSLANLKKQLRWIYKQKNEMIGLVMINKPSWISSFVAQWLRFFGNQVQVVTVKSYEEAIHAAERLLTERESQTL